MSSPFPKKPTNPNNRENMRDALTTFALRVWLRGRAALALEDRMKKFLIIGAALSALSLGACYRTDTQKAANAAYWNDKPADIQCQTYGVITYEGRSTGKIEYDEGGRLGFVDQKSNRYVIIEGECRVFYT